MGFGGRDVGTAVYARTASTAPLFVIRKASID
jgi:hypothetical protein